MIENLTMMIANISRPAQFIMTLILKVFMAWTFAPLEKVTTFYGKIVRFKALKLLLKII